MAVRPLLAALLLVLTAGCGGEAAADDGELRLLVPPGYAEKWVVRRETSCAVDIRVYDEDEDIVAIARRRDVDAVAGSEQVLERLDKAGELLPGSRLDDAVEYVRITLEGGVVLTLPRRLASAFHAVSTRTAGIRKTAWALRKGGGDRGCANQWIAHAISR